MNDLNALWAAVTGEGQGLSPTAGPAAPATQSSRPSTPTQPQSPTVQNSALENDTRLLARTANGELGQVWSELQLGDVSHWAQLDLSSLWTQASAAFDLSGEATPSQTNQGTTPQADTTTQRFSKDRWWEDTPRQASTTQSSSFLQDALESANWTFKKLTGQLTESSQPQTFDARTDAQALNEAMAGWGTDEEAIYKALKGKTPEQFDQMQKAYRDTYGKDLMTQLQSELSAEELKTALDGLERRKPATGQTAQSQGTATQGSQQQQSTQGTAQSTQTPPPPAQ
ncbi:MAG: annexin, partial [Candidatus Eremiobacterota bacterium]